MFNNFIFFEIFSMLFFVFIFLGGYIYLLFFRRGNEYLKKSFSNLKPQDLFILTVSSKTFIVVDF